MIQDSMYMYCAGQKKKNAGSQWHTRLALVPTSHPLTLSSLSCTLSAWQA